jgi:ketosteroid isomerase-like protein
MKAALVAAGVLLGPAMAGAQEAKAPTADAAAAQLAALEKRFAEAIIKGDAEAVQKVVGDDWIIIGPEGAITTKAAFLGVVKSGVLVHSTMDSDEQRVRVYGDSAVVTARVISAGTYQGQAFKTT